MLECTNLFTIDPQLSWLCFKALDRMMFFFLPLCMILANALAFPTAVTHTLHERRVTLPRGWTKSSRVDGGSILPMRIGLIQTNLHKAHDLLLDV